jgi:hypothetical protein
MVLSRDGFVMGSVVRFVLFRSSFISGCRCGLWPVATEMALGRRGHKFRL